MFRSVMTITRELYLYLTKIIFMLKRSVKLRCYIQGGSNMTGTDLCVNKPQSVPVIFEPPCIFGDMAACGREACRSTTCCCDIIVYYNLNLKLLTKLINSAFVGE